MSLIKIKFGDKEVNKKEFYSSKQAISIYSVDLNKIVVSNKLKINDTTYKYICGYLNNDTIQALHVILPQMNEYIKYFNDGGEKKNEKIYKKYNEIWEVIRNLLKKDFTISSVQDDIYLIAKFKIFDRINRIIYNSILIHMGKKHCICIPIINIDSILKINKRVYHQAYSKHFKYKLNNYINNEIIDEDSDSDSDTDDVIDSHLNFSVPDSYRFIKRA